MISILLPVYNGETFLKFSIESILNQSYKNFELLIGFNGTVDSSKEIAKSYNDVRIKIFDYGDDKGKPKTLNKLLFESKYDWVALQDDDDIWEINKLEKQIEHINNFDVIGSQILYCDSLNNIISGNPILELYDQNIKYKTIRGNNQVANSSVLMRKSSVIRVGGWDESLDGLEDYDLWIRLMVEGYRFTNLPDYLMIHRKHQNSNFNTMSNQKHDELMLRILRKNKIIS